MAAATANDRIVAIRVGLDLVSVAGVAEALESAFAERYLRRVYTDREVADCRTPGGIDPERLAARFAAKEATLKVISSGGEDGIPLAEIEVLRERSGRVSIVLAGRAAELAAAAGISDLQLSLTHEAGFAAAVVVGTGSTSPGPAASSGSAVGDVAGD